MSTKTLAFQEQREIGFCVLMQTSELHRNFKRNYYQLSTINYQLFKTPFSQPIIPINYSKIMPPFETPLKNVYLTNIQQVYPWDRGTNYAVELGQKIAKIVSEK